MPKPIRSCFVCVLILTGGCLVAEAQATRTWVSGVGDDVNPCSRTAPCKTFAGAISKTAAGGEINCLDPAGYGSVIITKSITLDCTGTNGSILATGTNGIVINGAKIVVRLRNLNINGAAKGTNGIVNPAGATVSVENVVIDGFVTGIAANGPSKYFLSNVTIRNNDNGITAATGANVHLFGSRVFGNKTGLSAKGGGTIISYKNNLVAGNDVDGAPTAEADLK